jgi:uncharacterized protein (DUF2132 family)
MLARERLHSSTEQAIAAHPNSEVSMSDEIKYSNSPLHGLSLKNLLVQLVDHYGFEILYAYLNINCFKTKPSIASSLKFLKQTDWARESVESFYLYEFKSLPRATPEQFALPPRDRVIPDCQQPGAPALLSLEDAERLRAKRAAKADARGQKPRPRRAPNKPHRDQRKSKPQHSAPKADSPWNTPSTDRSADTGSDPWANARKIQPH